MNSTSLKPMALWFGVCGWYIRLIVKSLAAFVLWSQPSIRMVIGFLHTYSSALLPLPPLIYMISLHKGSMPPPLSFRSLSLNSNFIWAPNPHSTSICQCDSSYLRLQVRLNALILTMYLFGFASFATHRYQILRGKGKDEVKD